MNLMDGEHDSELLQAQAHVWNHILNFINSMTLKCAIELGIPDIINKHGKPMTIDELVNALPIHQSKSQFVHRLMRILIHSGFFAQQKLSQINDHDEQGYVLTNASQLLLQDNPFSAVPILQAMLDPTLVSPWQQLSTWFRNDDPTAFATTNGMKIWEYAAHEPKFSHLFNEAMASDARLVTSVVIGKCRDVFQGLNSLVDVGGGTGTMAKAIAESFPHLECTCFDLPHVVAGLESEIDTLKYVGGDMFESVPQADAVLLKWILHDWNDEASVKILKKCKEAITASNKGKGKVIIIDMIREDKKEDEKSTETQHLMDMLTIVLYSSKERDEKEWAKLFVDAGFSDYKITPKLGLRSLIELYP